jgi:hypothetical protein
LFTGLVRDGPGFPGKNGKETDKISGPDNGCPDSREDGALDNFFLRTEFRNLHKVSHEERLKGTKRMDSVLSVPLSVLRVKLPGHPRGRQCCSFWSGFTRRHDGKQNDHDDNSCSSFIPFSIVIIVVKLQTAANRMDSVLSVPLSVLRVKLPGQPRGRQCCSF